MAALRDDAARPPLWRTAALGAAVAFAYLTTAVLGFRFALVAEQITTVWAPTGIALAALLLGGLRLWPAVWAGAFAANAVTAAPLWTALVIATGNTLEAVVAVALLRRVPGFDAALRRVADVLVFIGIAAAGATTISATIGVATLTAAAVQPWARFGTLWFDWWLGDALGAAIVAPAILAAARGGWTRRTIAVAASWVAGAAAVTHLVFRHPEPGSYPLQYLVFPVAVAAAVAAGRRVTSLVVLAASAVAIWHTAAGLGPFAGPDVRESLVQLQLFTGVLAATAMLLAAAIAERRAAEHRATETAIELEAREEMLHLAQRAGGVATFEWDFTAGIARCSPEFFPLFGLPARGGVITSDEWGGFVHPEDREWMAVHLERALAGDAPAAADYRIVAADGRTRWLSYAGQLQRTSAGIRMLGTVLDITGRKQAETALQQEVEVRTALAQVGASLAGELRSDRLAQAVTDAATQLTEAEFGAFFYNETDADGQSYSLYALSGAPKEAFAHLPQPRATTIFGPTFRGEATIRLDDVTQDPRYGRHAPHYGMPPGHLPVRSYLAVPVVGRGGAVLGGLFFGHSRAGMFTARHEALASGVAAWAAIALDNARLYRELEDANRVKDEFLATLSHELRTPLNAVLGWAHMLLEGSLDAALRQRAIESLERNARAQAQLVEDLLDVSRIMAGKLQVAADSVDLGAVIANAVDTVRAGVSAKRLDLQVRVPADRRLIVTGDADRLQQIVWNLVSNAIKFTPSGGRVDVELREAGSRAEILVRDTGQGIPPSFQPLLFQRFRQMDASKTRAHGGLGLGLSIVRHLTEAHGGSVTAESAGEDQGATFRVLLPLRSIAASLDGSAGDAQAPLDRRFAGVRALVVDDEADARELMRHFLERQGAEVVAAASAGEALHHLALAAFDVLIADIGMPHQDGLALIRMVRELPAMSANAGMPAIAVTAYAGGRERDEALGAGFDWHLSKPVDPEQLAAALVAATSRARDVERG